MMTCRFFFASMNKATNSSKTDFGSRFPARLLQSLESQDMGIPIGAVVRAATELRQRTAELARQAELSRQREEKRREAEILHKKLTEDLTGWATANSLRQFIAHVERELEAEPSKRNDYSENCLRWARGHATRLDPFLEGLDEFFNHYQQFGWDKMRRKR